jgi:hypothetical protein
LTIKHTCGQGRFLTIKHTCGHGRFLTIKHTCGHGRFLTLKRTNIDPKKAPSGLGRYGHGRIFQKPCDVPPGSHYGNKVELDFVVWNPKLISDLYLVDFDAFRTVFHLIF